MSTVRLTVRVSPDLKEQIDSLSDETGVPINTMVVRAIKGVLPARATLRCRAAKPKQRRRIAG